MANHIRKNKTGLAIALLLLFALVLLGLEHVFSFYNLGGATSAFIYINTYSYPSLAQLPAVVNYQFISSYKNVSSSCQTQIEYYNPDEFVTEIDAPINGDIYPISEKYEYPNQQGVNIALCIIGLPLQQYNSTTGELYLTASANGYTNQVKISLTLPSQYVYNQGGIESQPLLITIPLGSVATTTTTSTTTTTIPPSTSTTPIIPPVNQQQPISQSNFFNNIASAIQSFINSIIQAFAKWFAI